MSEICSAGATPKKEGIMKLLITGSAIFDNYLLVLVIAGTVVLEMERKPRLIIHTGAAGAESCVDKVAETLGIESEQMAPEVVMEIQDARTPAAVHEIIHEAGLVIAIWDTKSLRTAETIRRAIRSGIPTRVFQAVDSYWEEMTSFDIAMKLKEIDELVTV